MTEENSKRLYHHFLNHGKTKEAEELLQKYPQFAEKKTEVKEEVKVKKVKKK